MAFSAIIIRTITTMILVSTPMDGNFIITMHYNYVGLPL